MSIWGGILAAYILICLRVAIAVGAAQQDELASREMTLTELADRVGMSVVNLSILKNDRAKAVRFTTLTRLCDVLDCTPGDLFSVSPRR